MSAHPLRKLYHLEGNPEWTNLLAHLRLMEGFGFILVLAPEAAGAEVCRRELRSLLRKEGKTLHCHRIRAQDSPGKLADFLIHEDLPETTGAIWVSATPPRSVLNDRFARQRWSLALAALNPRRNLLRKRLRVPVIFAGPSWLAEEIRPVAPDLWSIRDTVAHIEPPSRPAGDFRQQAQIFSREDSGAEYSTGDPAETRAALEKLERRSVSLTERTSLEHLKADLHARLARQLAGRYEWDDAETAFLTAEKIFTQYPCDAKRQIGLWSDCADFYRRWGRYGQAEHYGRKAYEKALATFGPSHMQTADSKMYLANALYSQGKYADAEKEYRAVLGIRERVLEPEHPDTLKSRMNLANALESQGKHADAEKEYRAVLGIQERVLGPEHPDTLRSRMNLANALDSQGKHADAEKEYWAVLGIQERVLGAEHPDTLGSRMGVANALYSQGKHADAEKEHRAVLGIRARVLGPEHPNTLWSRNNLANALYSQGKHADAEKEYRAVLGIMERVLGPEHPDTLTSRMNLALALYSQGKHAHAEKEYRAVLGIQERVLGPERPNVFLTSFNLAGALFAQNKKAAALAFARRSEEGWRKVLGADHPDTKDAEQRRKRYEAAQGDD